MKFFIDTANLEQIKEMQELGIIDEVTTNLFFILEKIFKNPNRDQGLEAFLNDC